MSYDVAIYGCLSFPRGKAAAWRAAEIDTRALDRTARMFSSSPEVSGSHVAAHLDGLTELGQPGSGEVFELRASGDDLTVRGVLGEDTFRERARGIASSFLSAARHGAEGEVTMVGLGAALGYRIAVSDGRATLKALTTRGAGDAGGAPEVRECRELAVPAAARRILAEAREGVGRALAPSAPSADVAATASAEALDALRADEVAMLRAGPEPHWSEIGPRTATMVHLLGILRGARYEPAEALVVEIWRRHPWPLVRKRVEQLLLDWGTPGTVGPIADELEAFARHSEEYDQGTAQSLSAVEAVFRLDPRAAYERFLPYFDEGRTDPVAASIASGVWSVLARAGQTSPPGEGRALSLQWLRADPRWGELAKRVLREREDGTVFGAIEALTVLRDPGAAAAIVGLVDGGAVDLDTIVDALRTLGDVTVARAVREAARGRRKKADAAKLEGLAKELER